MTEKIPPVLSDEEIDATYSRPMIVLDSNDPLYDRSQHIARVIAQAQRDADVEWYEKKRVEWTRMDRDWLRIVKGWRRPEAVNTLIQQAQEEVAREIFEEIEENFARLGWMTIFIEGGGWQFLKSKHLKG